MAIQIKTNAISIGYANHLVIQNFTVSIRRGEFWGIVGANGSGKTTLVKTLTGVIPPLTGTMDRTAELSFGYVPQESHLDMIFPLTVKEVVLMGRIPRIGLGKKMSPTDIKLAEHYMDKVAIKHLSNTLFRVLSGGQKQRVLIARALAFEPDILVLDEPASGMDISGEAEMIQLILKLRKEIRQTVIMITHDLNVIVNYAEKLIILHNNEPSHFEIGEVNVLMTEEKIKQIYQQNVALLSVKNKIHVFIDDTDTITPETIKSEAIKSDAIKTESVIK